MIKPKGGSKLRTVSDPRSKPRTRERVVTELGKQIVGGKFAEGELLPKEAELSEQFDVSRTALREAMQTLSAKGLITSRPRVGTTVTPAKSWNQLDRDLMMWRDELEPNAQFVRGLIEFRRLIEPAAAAFAAERSTGADVARIEAGFNEMREAVLEGYDASEQVMDRWLSADQSFHLAILDATHNPIISALGTVIASALRNSFRLTASATDDFIATLDLHGEVLDAIRMRAPERASALVRELLDRASEDVVRFDEVDGRQDGKAN